MSLSGSADEIILHASTPHHDPILTSAGHGIDPSLSFMPASESSVSLDRLGERVADLKEVLDEIIREPEESLFFSSSKASQESWNTEQ